MGGHRLSIDTTFGTLIAMLTRGREVLDAADDRLGMIEALINHQREMLRAQHAAVAERLQQQQARFTETLAELTTRLDTAKALIGDHHAQMRALDEGANEALSPLFDAVDEVKERIEQHVEEFETGVDQVIQTGDELIEGYARTIEGFCDETGERIEVLTEGLGDGVGRLTGVLETTLVDGPVKLLETMTERINDGVGGVVAKVNEVENAIDDSIGRVVDQAHRVTDVLEPILPVFEAMNAVG
jgi:hypothetical protein